MKSIDLADFDFPLPAELIAQHPPADRDGGRLMVVGRGDGRLDHRLVRALPELLQEGDLLVVNTTRVLAARLRGQKSTGGAAEALLLGPGAAAGQFRALLRHSGRMRVGTQFKLGTPALEAELVEIQENGIGVLAFEAGIDPYAAGETPLPPYIERDAPLDADIARYQTTFAQEPGSVAAPTAGLHLSERLLEELGSAGIERAEVRLHVGLGTFRPLSAQDIARHALHSEPFDLPQATADAIKRTRARGGRVVAVGTTVTRVLESCATGKADGEVTARGGVTDLFLAPGDRFQVVDALLTNLHLPRSSLLLLVAAFAGQESMLNAYAQAVRDGYRFYSYGDAMLIQESPC
jgi:S-adenosylmethionine:tRNA ribosyltransferase-isomerase